MDTAKIKALIVVIVALFAALYLGIAAATAQFEVVIWIVGGLALTICLALGRRIWLIIPFMTTLGLVLPIPGNFSTEFLAQCATILFLTLLFLMRRLPMAVRFTELEFWCLVMVLFVVQAYARNPVGLNIFGSQTVGAKPYALFAVTLVAAYAMSIMRIDPNDLRWWVRLTLLGSIANFFIGMLGVFVPAIGYYLGASFASDVGNQNAVGGEMRDAGAASRVAFVRGLSRTLSLWIASRVPVLRAAFHPLWAPLILFTLGLAAVSGYRSQLAIVGLTYFVSLCYRGGFIHIVIATTIGAVLVGLLAFVNLVAPLPPNIQRALTVLPGTWESRYVQDAEGSTDWRTEIWLEALTSDRYIRNKALGDGLGFTVQQLERMGALAEMKYSGVGVSGFDAQRESILISGDYHSGPVQTIRVIGYAGLVFLLIGMVRLAVHAHRQIQRTRGTEWFSTALFIGIPIIWGPFFWVFIFGSFTEAVSLMLMGSALVRMLEKNLPLPDYMPRSRHLPLPLSTREQQPNGNSARA